MRLISVALLGLYAGLARPVSAQIGVTTDLIVGRVTSLEGHPIAGATVRAVSIETQISRTATTNVDGRYTIVFPDGGGRYEIGARAIGFPPGQLLIARQASEDRLVANITMGELDIHTSSDTIRIIAQRNRVDSTVENLQRLPIDPSDPNALATLAAGVVGLNATDTAGASFSVAGQRSSLNTVTLDGAMFSGQVPQEALRTANIITNDYDVARGQYTGGFIEFTTRGGTNTPSISVRYANRNSALAFGAQGPSAFNQLRDQNVLSGNIGEPIVRDHVFSFTAFNVARRSDQLIDLANADPATLAQLGITPGEAGAFLATLQAKHIPLTSPLVSDTRATDLLLLFQRFDFLIGNANSLVVRGDYIGQLQDGSHVSPYTLPTTGGHTDAGGGGLYLSLTTHLPGNFINEVRTYGRRFYQTTSPYLNGVSGRVDLASTSLSFGGSPSLPQSDYMDFWETADELSWLSPGGGHRFRLGVLLDVGRSAQLITNGANGIYTYNSLSAFVHDSAASFTRTFNARATATGSTSGAVYVGDAWVPWSSLQLTYGARVEATSFTGAPTATPWPSEIHANPRLGFSYALKGATVNGGFGEFRANAPMGLFSSAASENGLANGETQLVCIGAAVPPEQWTAPIPTSCAGGATTVGAPLRQVTVFDKDFESPRAWRGSLGVQKPLLRNLTASVDATYARGTALFGVTDANLNTAPALYLNDEGHRPVYSSTIDPTTGAVSYVGSRRYPKFGQVWDVNSRLHSDTRQVTVALRGSARRGVSYQLSYTYQHVRDQASFPGGSAASGFASSTTGGNPNIIGWAPSDLQRTHQFLGLITWPIVPSFDITSIARLNSGAPYTPLVNQDINGDGAANDRAFVFNPSALAPMRRLLTSGPSRIRDCLERQLGQIAGRNSCDGPWSAALDLQLNYHPSYFGLKGRLTLTLAAVNTLTGIDELVHGPQHLAGWGQPYPPDNVLLYVHGYDPLANRFIYTVNQHFGQPYSGLGAFGAPFQLSFQVRYNLADRPRQ